MKHKKTGNHPVKIILLIVLLAIAAVCWLSALREYGDLKKSEEHYKKACTYLENGQINDAREELEKSISAYPYNFEAYNALASISYLKKDYDSALEIYRSGLRHMPREAKLYFEISKIQYIQKDYCQALKSLKKAQKLDSSLINAELLSVYERTHGRTGRHTCPVD